MKIYHFYFLLCFIGMGVFPQNAYSQIRNMTVEGSGNQYAVIHTSSVGSSEAGIELIRANAFSGSDYKLVNEGGTLRIRSGIDNFATQGTTLFELGNSGRLNLAAGSEANIGSTGGILTIGALTGLHIAYDENEILARNGSDEANLLIQAGTSGNTYINQAGGNVAIGSNFAPVRLSIDNGTDVNVNDGGYLLLGRESTLSVAIDNNEIMARNNGAGSELHLQRDDGDLLLCALENGKVGIGVQSPGSLPDGDYLLAVDGGIIAEEVRVDLSSDWPDYVFEEDYKLRSIDNLKKDIKNLGHLPGVPSAQEMEEEGISLGAMQIIMMEKIEELSLYVIQLNEDNQKLEAQLKDLSKK